MSKLLVNIPIEARICATITRAGMKIRRAICQKIKHKYKFRDVVALQMSATGTPIKTDLDTSAMVCVRCKQIDPAWHDYVSEKIKKRFKK